MITNKSLMEHIAYVQLRGCQHDSIIVHPQTFSHTVMCKVCLTASRMVFSGDVRQNHWILSNIWNKTSKKKTTAFARTFFRSAIIISKSIKKFWGRGCNNFLSLHLLVLCPTDASIHGALLSRAWLDHKTSTNLHKCLHFYIHYIHIIICDARITHLSKKKCNATQNCI